MEQSTQTNNIIERPKKKKGRPKGTAIFTEEENKERARQRARKKAIRISWKKHCLNLYYFCLLYFC